MNNDDRNDATRRSEADSVTAARPLYIPVILGTVRQGRASENVARFVLAELRKRAGVETELIDIRELRLPSNDEGGNIKDARFSEQLNRGDGLVVSASAAAEGVFPDVGCGVDGRA